MSSLSKLAPLTPDQRASYGVARAKSIAFEAVHTLWRRRKAEGRSQSDLAKALGKDKGWLSRSLRGPGNWTIKTLGEMVEALDGELEIIVHGAEDPISDQSNYHAYADYEPCTTKLITKDAPSISATNKATSIFVVAE
jgi:transcriptional regulator with XRE-family HTH domain